MSLCETAKMWVFEGAQLLSSSASNPLPSLSSFFADRFPRNRPQIKDQKGGTDQQVAKHTQQEKTQRRFPKSRRRLLHTTFTRVHRIRPRLWLLVCRYLRG
jgi:hypothetical protein